MSIPGRTGDRRRRSRLRSSLGSGSPDARSMSLGTDDGGLPPMTVVRTRRDSGRTASGWWTVITIRQRGRCSGSRSRPAPVLGHAAADETLGRARRASRGPPAHAPAETSNETAYCARPSACAHTSSPPHWAGVGPHLARARGLDRRRRDRATCRTGTAVAPLPDSNIPLYPALLASQPPERT